MKTVAALTIAAAVVLLAGCGADTDSVNAPSTTTTQVTSTAAPTGSAAQTISTSVAPPTTTTTNGGTTGAGLRSQTCNDLLPMLQSMREVGGDAAVAKAVDETLAWIPQQPTWASLSETERQSTLDGVRDAGAGTCK